MPIVIAFFVGQWIGQFFYFMFAHPLRFLIGLVRIALWFAALAIGVFVPLTMSGSGWIWVVGPVLIAFLLLFFQRKLRDFSDGL